MTIALYLRSLLNEGGLAQLVERLHGMQEVIGSNPLSSTWENRRGGREKRGFHGGARRYGDTRRFFSVHLRTSELLRGTPPFFLESNN